MAPVQKLDSFRRSPKVNKRSIAGSNLRIKRAYEAPQKADGTRILVDRLWPRGLRKADAKLDEWIKEIAPSADLRTWFGHDPKRWQEFRRRYRTQLAGHSETLNDLRRRAGEGAITLIYAASDDIHNHAVVLRDAILGTKEHSNDARALSAGDAQPHAQAP